MTTLTMDDINKAIALVEKLKPVAPPASIVITRLAPVNGFYRVEAGKKYHLLMTKLNWEKIKHMLSIEEEPVLNSLGSLSRIAIIESDEVAMHLLCSAIYEANPYVRPIETLFDQSAE